MTLATARKTDVRAARKFQPHPAKDEAGQRRRAGVGDASFGGAEVATRARVEMEAEDDRAASRLLAEQPGHDEDADDDQRRGGGAKESVGENVGKTAAAAGGDGTPRRGVRQVHERLGGLQPRAVRQPVGRDLQVERQGADVVKKFLRR